MSELGNDELFLKGRVQFETALGALVHTNMNPTAQARLKTLLEVHSQISDSGQQTDLSLYLKGDVAMSEKADILASLEAQVTDTTTLEATRLAAIALHEIMQQ